jgi:hypothetical protein
MSTEYTFWLKAVVYQDRIEWTASTPNYVVQGHGPTPTAALEDAHEQLAKQLADGESMISDSNDKGGV